MRKLPKITKDNFQQFTFIAFVFMTAIALFSKGDFFNVFAFIFGIAFGVTMILDWLS